jgi:hypothetical protein
MVGFDESGQMTREEMLRRVEILGQVAQELIGPARARDSSMCAQALTDAVDALQDAADLLKRKLQPHRVLFPQGGEA